MSKAADKRARVRLLAAYQLLQHEWSQAHMSQWLHSATQIDRRVLDVLAQTILGYVLSVRSPLERRQFLHDAELVEDIVAEVFPPKIAYVRKRGRKAA